MYTTFAYVYTSTEFEGNVQEPHSGLILELHIYWINEEGYHYWNCNWNRKITKWKLKQKLEFFLKTQTNLKLKNYTDNLTETEKNSHNLNHTGTVMFWVFLQIWYAPGEYIHDILHQYEVHLGSLGL